MEDTIELHWCKASYSGNGGGSCVEVGTGLPGKVAVRDSKDREGPMLTVSAQTWAKFTEGIKHGELIFEGPGLAAPDGLLPCDVATATLAVLRQATAPPPGR